LTIASTSICIPKSQFLRGLARPSRPSWMDMPAARCRGMRTHAATVDHPQVPVDATLFVESHLQPFQDGVERALFAPAAEAVVGRLPRAITLGQIAPGRARIQNPKHGGDHRAMASPRPAVALLGRREQIGDQLPLFVRQSVAPHRCDLAQTSSSSPLLRTLPKNDYKTKPRSPNDKTKAESLFFVANL
jgi:hypothetical protein